jgi:uncharacterized membrane protein
MAAISSSTKNSTTSYRWNKLFLLLLLRHSCFICAFTPSSSKQQQQQQQQQRHSDYGLLSISSVRPARGRRTARTSSSFRHGNRLIATKTRRSYTPRSWSILNNSNDDNDDVVATTKSTVWMPKLRQIMAGIASLGVVETGYLSYAKLFTNNLPAFCSGGSGEGPSPCQSVLTGPYSTMPFTNIPLATLGFIAYLTVGYLSLSPLLSPKDEDTIITDDTNNRILLTSLTSVMGTFSIFLMTLLFGVLHTSCPYCVFSAACSLILAQLTWIGGCLPESNGDDSANTTTTGSTSINNGIAVGTSFTVATAAAILLYISGAPSMDNTGGSGSTLLASVGSSSTVVSGTNQKTTLYSPPAITAASSDKALLVAKSLQSLDAKMYGAYWCSHCFDQKQILGKQAFENYVQYVECSKDGVNSQTKLCKAKDVPGYPTWEIKGKLFPGQVDLDELQEIVDGVLTGK